MRFIKSALPLFFLFLHFNLSFGQACYHGTYHCRFVNEDYRVPKRVKYEFLPLAREIWEDPDFRVKYPNLEIGYALSAEEAAELTRSNPSLAEYRHLRQCLKKSKLHISGRQKANFRFYTLEVLYEPLVLRLKTGDETFYFVGNFFGSCSRRNVFFLGE